MEAKVIHQNISRQTKALIKIAPPFASIVDTIGPLTLPKHQDPFFALVRTIIFQQISTKAAETIFGRLLHLLDGKLSPGSIQNQTIESLRAVGISRPKANYILDISRRFKESADFFKDLDNHADALIIEKLIAMKGIGNWTANMFLLFTLGREDIFTADDLGLYKGTIQIFGLPETSSKREVEQFAKQWSPYRSMASLYIWKFFHLEK